MAKTKDRSPSVAFRTTLKREPDSGEIALIEVPADVRAVFGKARPPVNATLGKYMFRTTIAVYGGKSYVGVRRSHREAAKLEAGQTIRVVLELDDAPRVVKVPRELAAAFRTNTKVKAAWAALSYSHRREHAEAIESAKKPETRARRVAASIAMLERK